MRNSSSIDDKILTRIAQAIRRRRGELSLTVRALASRSGVSSSMISDVERAAKSPTISTLAALSEALEIPLSTLVESQEPARLRVVKAAERQWLVESGTGAKRDRFVPTVAGSEVEFLRYVVPPKTLAGPFPAHAPGTIEHVYLVAGAIRITLGNDVADLEAGDSCSCYADLPHGFDNRDGKTPAEFIIVVEPPRASTSDRARRHERGQ
ncbi:XRE family transcriptional regulator [Bradyrhizobium sp. UNPF46]|uniref:helix-turn-helix domain-containing protein n=1 Tax=Bradyrhizobium sp. UNPF46 TaxID=1141168 RepID=UPI00114E60E3|nr:XRE family transcriptional regulator [Bradyrhizobium sp. UNPF46]